MRTRGVIGKRIARIDQQRIVTPSGAVIYHLVAIVLEDGTRLAATVAELECEYAIVMNAYKPRGAA